MNSKEYDEWQQREATLMGNLRVLNEHADSLQEDLQAFLHALRHVRETHDAQMQAQDAFGRAVHVLTQGLK